MMGIMWVANILIGFIDLILFIQIASLILRDYKNTKAKIMKNLLIFSIFMVVYALSSIISSIYLSMSFGYNVALPLLVVNIISVAGFILLYNVIRT